MSKAVIFDFDGTIADTFRVGLDIYYQLTGRGKIPKGEIDRLRSMNFRRAIRELKIPFWKAPWLLFKGRRELTRRIDEVQLFYGVPELIRALEKDGYELHIISLNSEKNIRRLLKLHGLEESFTSVYGRSRIRGKVHIIRLALKHYHYAKAKTVYVGDEIRDVHAAQAAGVSVIAVTWGYNNVHVLEASNPGKIVFDPSEVKAAVRELVG